MEITENVKDCWSCKFQNINSQTTLIGNCEKVTRNNPEGKKEIPGDFVDIGCKLWREKKMGATNVHNNIRLY
jgi:hypothetical protein